MTEKFTFPSPPLSHSPSTHTLSPSQFSLPVSPLSFPLDLSVFPFFILLSLCLPLCVCRSLSPMSAQTAQTDTAMETHNSHPSLQQLQRSSSTVLSFCRSHMTPAPCGHMFVCERVCLCVCVQYVCACLGFQFGGPADDTCTGPTRCQISSVPTVVRVSLVLVSVYYNTLA